MKKLNLFLSSLLILLLAGPVLGAGYGKRQSTQIGSLSNDANGCFEDQTTSGATALTLDGALVASSKCVFASAQQISIEGTGNNSGITFAIVGTDADGKYEAESLTGANNGTAKSARWYKTITSITPSGAVTGNVEGGPLSTNGAVSETLVPDLAGWSALMSLVLDITGTMTVTVEHTSYNYPSSAEGVWFDTVDMTSVTADTEGNIVAPVGGVRAKITAYTSGSVDLLMLQDSKR